jgi:hypothetical protein
MCGGSVKWVLQQTGSLRTEGAYAAQRGVYLLAVCHLIQALWRSLACVDDLCY